MTTPNKSNYPATVLWETAPPPTHLWWFSENSIETIATRLGLSASLLDFSLYNCRHHQTLKLVTARWKPTRRPRIDSEGRPMGRRAQAVRSALKSWKSSSVMLETARRLRGVVSPYRVRLTTRSQSLCTVFRTQSAQK